MRSKAILSIIFIQSLVLNAQDATFSISDFNPMNLNPAYAISGDGQLKLFSSSRQQWLNLDGPQANSPSYLIHQVTLCAPIQSSRGSGFGIAIQLNNQTAGEGALEMNGGRITGAARFSGKFKRHNYSFASGVGIGMSQYSLDWGNLRFASQYDSFYGFIQTTPLVNPQAIQSNIGISANLGLRFAYSHEYRSGSIIAIKSGYGLFHANNTALSFFDNNSILFPRHVFHNSIIYLPNSTKGIKGTPLNYYIAGLVILQQGPVSTSELRLGTNINPGMNLFMMYRSQYLLPIENRVDAICFQTQIKLNQFLMSIGYDLTISELNNMRTYGTTEIGVMIPLGKNNPIGNKKVQASCQAEQVLSHALWKMNEKFDSKGRVFNKEFSSLSLVL